MAQRAPITLADGQATPVNHTFTPNAGDGNVPGVSIIEYEDRSLGVIAGYPTVAIQTRRNTAKNTNRKVAVNVTVPVLEQSTDSSASGYVAPPKRAYELVFRGEYIIPARASLAQRKDLNAYVKNLVANAVMTAAIEETDSPY